MSRNAFGVVTHLTVRSAFPTHPGLKADIRVGHCERHLRHLRAGSTQGTVSEMPARPFEQPTLIERIFNSAIGALVRLGIGLPDMRVLEVRGRKSGKVYSLPVDLLPEGGKLFLVAPRGYTQWVRNAEASGVVTLRRGRHAVRYRLRPLVDAEKPAILRAYLDRFRREVQKFFPVPAGSPTDAFVAIAQRYPAFELLPES